MAGRSRDMTSGSPFRLIVSLAFPLMLGNVFQQMYTVVDTIVLGNAVGVHALAAIGAADWLNWMLLGIITGATQGFSILIAQRFGAGDREGLRRAVAMSVLLTAGLAVGSTLISQLAARPVLLLLGTPEEVLGSSLLFLRINYGAIVVVAAYNIQASILRALGDGRAPLIAMVIASLINIVLDILFVVGFGWGIAGACAATVIAQVFSSLFCLQVVRKIPELALTREDWQPERPLLLRLVKLGTPMAFQNAIIAVGGIVVQHIVNGFGMVFMAGFTATNKLYGLLELSATAFGFSMATYMGQNLGARKLDRIRQGMRAALVIFTATAVITSLAMILFGENIVGMFISDTPEITAQAVGVAYRYLLVMSYPLFVLYFLHLYRSSLQGLGDTMVPMLSGIIELVMRVGIILTLPGLLGEYGVFLAEVFAWLGAAVLLMSMYYVRVHRIARLEAQGQEWAQV